MENVWRLRCDVSARPALCECSRWVQYGSDTSRAARSEPGPYWTSPIVVLAEASTRVLFAPIPSALRLALPRSSTTRPLRQTPTFRLYSGTRNRFISRPHSNKNKNTHWRPSTRTFAFVYSSSGLLVRRLGVCRTTE